MKLGKPDPGPLPRTTGNFLYVTEDPDRAWQQIAPYAMHEMNAYGQWMAEAGTTGPYRPIEDPDELRKTRRVRADDARSADRDRARHERLRHDPVPSADGRDGPRAVVGFAAPVRVEGAARAARTARDGELTRWSGSSSSSTSCSTSRITSTRSCATTARGPTRILFADHLLRDRAGRDAVPARRLAAVRGGRRVRDRRARSARGQRCCSRSRRSSATP